MSITPDSATQPEQPQPVSDEFLYRAKGSGIAERNDNRPLGKNGYLKRIDKITARNHALEGRIVEQTDYIHKLEIKLQELQAENDYFMRQLLERLNEKECTAEALAVAAENLAQELETKISNRAAPIGQLGR
jgi:predicted RNase H-like nuclease (RuvC/YqgF family)